MTPLSASTDDASRLTPAVIRVLEWHRRMYAESHQQKSHLSRNNDAHLQGAPQTLPATLGGAASQPQA